MKGERIQVLDHGYIQRIGTWGSDEEVIESARQSTDKGFLGWEPQDCVCTGASVNASVMMSYDHRSDPDQNCKFCEGTGKLRGDKHLLRYLWDNAHSTPFEFAGLTIEVQAPILTFREWHRHRVPFGYSELSARYSPMPNLNYLPTPERCMVGSGGTNKQAGTVKWAEPLTDEKALAWLGRVEKYYEFGEELYQEGLAIGIPKEVARIVITVGRYSRMRATGNLRGWIGFLKLRQAKGAQQEIRVYANEVAKILTEKFPRTMALYEGSKP